MEGGTKNSFGSLGIWDGLKPSWSILLDVVVKDSSVNHEASLMIINLKIIIESFMKKSLV